jgi:hypothetical protein
VAVEAISRDCDWDTRGMVMINKEFNNLILLLPCGALQPSIRLFSIHAALIRWITGGKYLLE